MSDPNSAAVSALLKKLTEKESIADPEYEFSKATVKGDGYVGVIDAVKIKSHGKEVLSVIIKTSPTNKILRAQMNIHAIYDHEIFFYTELFPAYNKLQLDKGVEEPFDNVPKCYTTSLVEEQEGLVLENLRDKGYTLWNRMLPMNEEHILITLKTYAKLHALSFAYKDQHREKFENARGRLVDIYEEFSKSPMHAEVYKAMFQGTKALLDPEADKKHFEKFSNFIQSAIDNETKFMAKSMDEYSVILHGDGWCNNMMYRYGDSSNPKKPTHMCILDYQILRYGSPILDVSHFFYTSASKAIMADYQQYLEIYYTCLCDFIKQLGSDPEKVYPRSVFEIHWKKYCTNGLQVALFMIKLISAQSDEVPNFDDFTDDQSLFEAMGYELKNTDYKERIKDVIIHFSENNLI